MESTPRISYGLRRGSAQDTKVLSMGVFVAKILSYLLTITPVPAARTFSIMFIRYGGP